MRLNLSCPSQSSKQLLYLRPRLNLSCSSRSSKQLSGFAQISLVRALVPHIQNITMHGVCNECAVAISTFSRRWCFYWLCEASARAIKIGRPEKNVGLPCSYLPTLNRPYPKKSLPFWESLFSFFFFSNSVNKLFFKISKSCFFNWRKVT